MNLMISETSLQHAAAAIGATHADVAVDILSYALDMRGTPLHRRVWEKFRSIPVGRTVTYMELARWISPLASAHVIAGACAANPIALAIPCHRLVRADGDLAGYPWGI